MKALWKSLLVLSRQARKIGNHVNEDVDALEEDGLVDELVVVVEEDRGAVEGGETNGRHPNLRDGQCTIVDRPTQLYVNIQIQKT